MIRMRGTTHENLEAIRGFRLPLGRVCLSPVLRFLLSNRRHHHRDGAVKGTQRFGLRWRLLVRKFAIAVAQVSRFGDACPDVIVQIAGQVQHQMSSAIPVGIGFAPELLVRKRIHPFVQMGCNIFVICCQPRSYRFAHLCHERGSLCSHPTGYLDELQLRRVYSISQNADNSPPRAKVKASLRRSCNSRESGPKTMPQLFNPDWVCKQARGKSIEFQTRYVPHGKYSEILSLSLTRLSAPPPLHPTVAAPSATPVPLSTDANGYELEPGPYTVAEVEDLVLHDMNRGKDLHVRIFYPNDSGKYPVIVFSHGAGGSQSCCDGLTRHWAAYGYVTIRPTHDDSAVQRRNQGEENIRFMQAVRDALKKPALWESRPLDITSVLD